MNGTQAPNGSTNQSINHQGRLLIRAAHGNGYTRCLAETASALAGVEGYQLNPSQGAGLPVSEAPAKGSAFENSSHEAEIKRIEYPPRHCKPHIQSYLQRGVTRL
jgi:hypothetical protein